jgi:hypothetical protein
MAGIDKFRNLGTRGNGWYFVRYMDGKKRRTIALDTNEEQDATTARKHILHILTAKRQGTPIHPTTATWLEFDKKLQRRLIKAGLVAGNPADEPSITLGKFLNDYFARRSDVKPATRIHWEQTRRNLEAMFGADRRLDSITPGEARDFERFLKTSAREMRYADAHRADGLKPDTVRKRITNAKQFFADALDRELVDRNPFAALKGGQRGNRQRDFFVTHADAQKVLSACPDGQWRLLFALCRYGGLR